MVNPEKPRREIIELWLSVMDGDVPSDDRSEASEEQVALLNDLILNDPESRQEIIALANQQAWLMWYGSQSESSAADMGDVEEVLSCINTFIGKPKEENLDSSSVSDSVAEPEAETEVPLDKDALSKPRIVSSLSSEIPLEGVTYLSPYDRVLNIAKSWSPVVLLLLVGGVASILWLRYLDPMEEPRIVEKALGIDGVSLESDTVRMNLPNVGYMDVEGTADLKILSPTHVRLDRGRIRVRVTEKTKLGFLVSTPHGDVIDLGTEFGLDVSDLNPTELVVFEGEVKLSREGLSSFPLETRLAEGEGARFLREGDVGRIMSIVTGKVATFQGSRRDDTSETAVIAEVRDNLPENETRLFYEIVRSGMGEDVSAFVDRTYEWNGLDTSGMPEFLLGADYVKTFYSHKLRSFEVTITLGKPADLYLFWDDRVPATQWLRRDFTDTGLNLGLDEKPSNEHRPNAVGGIGPGVEIDRTYSIWRRSVATPSDVTIGSLELDTTRAGMYGIAAVPIASERGETEASASERPLKQEP